MRDDSTGNLVLELLLFGAAALWWLSRTPAVPRRRVLNLFHGILPANVATALHGALLGSAGNVVVSFPAESLAVNVASLLGTVLSAELRPSQAAFSVALVLHDAWPLLFVPSSTGPIANTRNIARAATLAAAFVVVYIALALVGLSSLLNAAGALCGWLAGTGAAFVATRIAVDFLNQLVLQHVSASSSSSSSSSSTAVVGTEKNVAVLDGITPPPGTSVVDVDAAAATPPSVSVSSPTSAVPGLIANATMLDPASTNYAQHLALIITYCIYAAMLLADYTTAFESGPWFVYTSGSVAVEIVRYYWCMRHRTMNVDTPI